jgi:hypothetical protein
VLVRRIAAMLIDLAPRWLWKPGNLRLVGSHALHFCFGYDGRRTVEWDTREIAAGRRQWLADDGAESHPDTS